MAYIAALTLVFVVATSVGLGFADENWFLEFGLVIVTVSVAASMILAFRSGRKAAQAEKVSYESYLPEIDDGESNFYKFTAGMMGASPREPLKHIEDKISELQRASIQDEKNYRAYNKMTNYRVSICLAQIRYHEQVTLPKILGQGSGSIILASALTIIGSAYLALPAPLYERFSAAASALKALASSL